MIFHEIFSFSLEAIGKVAARDAVLNLGREAGKSYFVWMNFI
jgi:hypothetical protein